MPGRALTQTQVCLLETVHRAHMPKGPAHRSGRGPLNESVRRVPNLAGHRRSGSRSRSSRCRSSRCRSSRCRSSSRRRCGAGGAGAGGRAASSQAQRGNDNGSGDAGNLDLGVHLTPKSDGNIWPSVIGSGAAQ